MPGQKATNSCRKSAELEAAHSRASSGRNRHNARSPARGRGTLAQDDDTSAALTRGRNAPPTGQASAARYTPQPLAETCPAPLSP